MLFPEDGIQRDKSLDGHRLNGPFPSHIVVGAPNLELLYKESSDSSAIYSQATDANTDGPQQSVCFK